MDLGDNQLLALPAAIGRLTGLMQLDLNNNQLTTLQAEIGWLIGLKQLNLTDTKLSLSSILILRALRENISPPPPSPPASRTRRFFPLRPIDLAAAAVAARIPHAPVFPLQPIAIDLAAAAAAAGPPAWQSLPDVEAASEHTVAASFI